MVDFNSSSACSAFSRLLEKICGSSSSTCFFHWVICVGCTPYSLAISLVVFCPRMASRATFAFKSALYRFLCPVIFSSLLELFSIQLFYLMQLSEMLGPLYTYTAENGNKKENDKHLLA